MTEPANLPEAQQTVLGLYLTAKEAHERWRAAPEQAMLLDVRTPEEYAQDDRARQGMEHGGVELEATERRTV